MQPELLSVKDFAAKIKAKYPQYEGMDDATLTQKIIDKYPSYKRQLDLSGLQASSKKKELSVSASGDTTSSSQSQNPNFSQDAANRLNEYVQKNKQPEFHIDEKDPVKSILNPLRQQYQKAQNEYNPYRNRAVQDATVNKVLPSNLVNQTADEVNNKQKEEKFSLANLTATHEAIKSEADDVKKARTLLESVRQKNGGQIPVGNETAQLAKEGIDEYNSLVNGIKNNKGIVGAAIQEELKHNPEFAQSYKTLDGKIPASKEGQLVASFMQRHGQNLQTFAEEHPEYASQLKDLSENFADKYPEATAAQIGNEVSQEYEKHSSAFADLDTEGFNKKVDDIAANLYKDNPKKLELYNKLVKDNKDKYFRSGAALNAFGGGVFGGLQSMGNTLKDITGLRDAKDRAFESLDAEGKYVTPNTKGIREWTSTSSGFLGTIAPLGAETGLLKGAGVSAFGAQAVPVITQFYDDQLKQAESRFGEGWRAKLSADLSTALFAVAPDVIPTGKLSGAFDNILKDVSEKTAVSSVKARLTNAVGEALQQYGKGVGEMTAITKAGQIVDAALGKPHQDADEELYNTAKSMAMGNVIPALAHGLGHYVGSKVEEPAQKSELDQAIENLPEGTFTSALKQASETDRQDYLKNIAEQLSDPKSAKVTRKTFGDKISDIALKLFPDAKPEPSNIEQSINKGSGEDIAKGEQGVGGELDKGVEVGTNSSGENIGDKTVEVPDEFSNFKNHVLDTVLDVKGSEFEHTFSFNMDYKTREQAVKNIREGKDTKAARQMLDEIKQMYDDGYVYLNRGRGNHTERIQIPIKDYMAEINKPFVPEVDLDELNTLLGEEAFNETFDKHYNDTINETARTGETSETTPTTEGQTAEANPKTTIGESKGNAPEQPIGKSNEGQPPAEEPSINHEEVYGKDLHEASQGKLSLDFIDDREFLKSNNPRELREVQKGIRRKLSIINELIKCK